MTDAREIIAKAVSVARGETPIGGRWANLSLKDRDMAELGVRRVVAAGFRILGPDEVDPTVVRPLDDWHEDFGDVVWWTWRDGEWLGEPSYIGTPNDSDWPGYHTHWSPHPPFPRAIGRRA